MTQINADGLYLKFGLEEAAANKGGTDSTLGPFNVTEVTVTAADWVLASNRIGSTNGSLGVQLPRKAIVEKIEIYTKTAFTSSGTIGSATMVLGLVKDDLSTENDFDGYMTSSAVVSGLGAATAGSLITFTKASTGAGALIGVAATDAGYLTLSNSAHASHPVAAGTLVLRIYWSIQDVAALTPA